VTQGIMVELHIILQQRAFLADADPDPLRSFLDLKAELLV